MAATAQIFQALLTSQRAGGATLASGRAYFYSPGTTDLKTVYLDRAKQSPADNPYTLSADGNAAIYGDGLYDVKITNSAGVQKYFWEDVKIQNEAGETFANISDYASLAAAVTAIGATKTTLIIGTDQAVADDLTIPITLELMPINGAILTVASGKALVINSSFNAGPYQVFAGTGTVTFGPGAVSEVFPQWKGGVPGATTAGAADSTTALVWAFSLGLPVRLTNGAWKTTAELIPSDGTQIRGSGAFFIQYEANLPSPLDVPYIFYDGAGGANSAVIRFSKLAVGTHPSSLPDESETLRNAGISGVVIDGNDKAEYGLYSARAGLGNIYEHMMITGTLKCAGWFNEFYTGEVRNIYPVFNSGAGLLIGYDTFGWGQALSVVDNMDLRNVRAQRNGGAQTFTETPTATTGSITALSATLTVASATGISVGSPVTIAGAGLAGVPLNTTVKTIVGTTVTLVTAASTTVSGAAVTISHLFEGIGIGLFWNRVNGAYNVVAEFTDGAGIVIASRGGTNTYMNIYAEDNGHYDAGGGTALATGRMTKAWGMIYYNRETSGWFGGDGVHNKLISLFGGQPSGREQWIWLTGDVVSSLVNEPTEPVAFDGVFNIKGIKSGFYNYSLTNVQAAITDNTAATMLGCLPSAGDFAGIKGGVATLYVSNAASGDKSGRDTSNYIGSMATALEIAKRATGVATINIAAVTTATDVFLNCYGLNQDITIAGGASTAIAQSATATNALRIRNCFPKMIVSGVNSVGRVKVEQSNVKFLNTNINVTGSSADAGFLVVNSRLELDTCPMDLSTKTAEYRGFAIYGASTVVATSSDVTNFGAGLAVEIKKGGGMFFTGQVLIAANITWEAGGQGAVYVPASIFLSGATK
jgi:hypothetical protein